MPAGRTYRWRPFGDASPADWRARFDRVAVATIDGLVAATGRAQEARERIGATWSKGRVLEAVSGGYGSRDAQADSTFRQLTHRPGLEMSQAARDRAIELAWKLYVSSAPIKAATDIATGYVVGDGFTVTSDDEAVQAALDAHWMERPNNDWPQRLEERARLLGLYGTLVMPRFVERATGETRLSWIHPLKIERLERDPENPSIVIGVRERGSLLAMKGPVWRIVMSDAEIDHVSWRARALWTQWGKEFANGDGQPREAFAFCVNSPEPGDLGIPDLASGFDAAAVMDILYEDILTRFQFSGNVVWKVLVKSMTTKQKRDEWLAEHKSPPKPGSIIAHNEQEDWDLVVPQIPAADYAEIVNIYLETVARAGKFPKHWLSSPEDSNRATALASGSPTLRALKTRQSFVVRIAETVLDDRLAQGVKAGRLDRAILADKSAYKVTPSKIVEDDTTAQSGTLNVITMSLSQAQQEGWITYETAVHMYAELAGRATGVEIDPSKEIDAMLGRGRDPSAGYWDAGNPETDPANVAAMDVAATAGDAAAPKPGGPRSTVDGRTVAGAVAEAAALRLDYGPRRKRRAP